MQRLGNSCSVHRRTIALPIRLPPGYLVVRHIGRSPWPKNGVAKQLADNAPIFDVNSLLLDLDAENNKHVRLFDPEIDGEQEGRYAKRDRDIKPLERRIASFNAKNHDMKARFKYLLDQRHYEWRINDLDLLSNVLHGFSHGHSPATRGLSDTEDTFSDFEAPWSTSQEMNRYILWRNGIPPIAAQNATKTTTHLLHRQGQARDHTDQEYTDVKWQTKMSRQIREETSFAKLKRAIQYIICTSGGPQRISELSGELGDKCAGFPLTEEPNHSPGALNVSVTDMLVFCNDVVLNLLAKGLPVQKQLWSLGYRLAVECSVFSAAQMHLTAAFGVQRKDSNGIEELRGFLHTTLNSFDGVPNPRNLWPAGSIPHERLAVSFSILGQYYRSGKDNYVSIHSMVQSIAASDYSVLALYVQILGEIGALRTLWHTYQQLSVILASEKELIQPHHRSSGLQSLNSRLFVYAFLRHVQNVTKGHCHSVYSIRQEASTGNFEKDCRLDMQKLQASRTIQQDYPVESREVDKKIFRAGLSAPAPFENRKPDASTASLDVLAKQDIPVLGSLFEDEIIKAFRNSDIKQSMIQLDGLLKRATT